MIGLDWGTSCTKVVVRTPYVGGGRAYAVDFTRLAPGPNPYLIPSRVHVGTDGQTALAPFPGSRPVHGLKLRIVGVPQGPEVQDDGVDPMEAATAYLAWIVSETRSWFLREHEEEFRQYEPRWSCNLGFPAAGFDDTELMARYRLLLASAWHLSERSSSRSLTDARHALASAGELTLGSPGTFDHLQIAPEVGAQIAGYAKSPERRLDLHVLVDVGALTIDVAGFFLTEDAGDLTCGFLDARVDRQGAFVLHQVRCDALRRHAEQTLPPDEFDAWCDAAPVAEDPMAEVPKSWRSYKPEFPKLANLAPDPDAPFKRTTHLLLENVLHELRVRQYPGSPRWAEGVPVFVCGGGHAVAPYHEGVQYVARRWLSQMRSVAPFKVSSMTVPQKLEAPRLRDTDFHRLSVAYGLSFPFDDLGWLRPPSDFAPMPPPAAPVEQRTRPHHEDTKDLM